MFRGVWARRRGSVVGVYGSPDAKESERGGWPNVVEPEAVDSHCVWPQVWLAAKASHGSGG